MVTFRSGSPPSPGMPLPGVGAREVRWLDVQPLVIFLPAVVAWVLDPFARDLCSREAV